ncbi:MAG TPA: Ig-like domain-containing protein [Steroidobacteraceae bacterium]|nr:Ig-like domain-containing protein [Steroidobacteraceae bacterium]
MQFITAARSAAIVTLVLAGGCAGSGKGLDQNGEPISAGGGASEPLTPDFQSIQDNVFTPICTRCHIGASAPEGLQLDEAHSYALLVGIPSVEQGSLLRIKAGDPDNSYLIRKIQGGPGITGGQMPLGGPPLSQDTIAVIRQWVAEGALQSAMAQAPTAIAREELQRAFSVTAVSPAPGASLQAPLSQIVVAFSHEIDVSSINPSTVVLEKVGASELMPALEPAVPVALSLADGNPTTLLVRPLAPLDAGTYRLTLRGTGAGAVADLSAVSLGTDEYFVFTVEASS